MTSIGGRVVYLIKNSESVAPALLALAVGLSAGFGAIAFRYLIQWAHWLFFEGGADLASSFPLFDLGRSYIIVVPVLGMILVTLIVRRWAPEAKGHGVPEVQYAVKKKGGRVRLRVAIIKSLASALNIGSGGSVGREGPIVQIGCSIGSNIGQLFKLSESEVKLLLACGAAGGIAGTFNAPVAGVMFALEVILGVFAARSFSLLVISSVTAVAVCQAFLGKQPAFELIQPFALQSFWEFPLYLMLGLFLAVISLAYVRSIYFFEEVFERWDFNVYLKAAIGGLGVGLLGFFGSELVFGVGYEGVEMALSGSFELYFLLALLLMKILATSFTLGAGGSGGVFAPSLFIGVMAGAAFGLIANQLFPAVTAPPGAYALVGMAAVFAGAAHAPITSVIIVFEMTDDYRIILPLMLAAGVSYLVSYGLSKDSIYTIKLRRLGGFAPPKPEVGILDVVVVRDAMTTDIKTARPDMSVTELSNFFEESGARSAPVLDRAGRLAGIVTDSDLQDLAVEGELEGFTVADIMTTHLITCTPDDSLLTAMQRLTKKDIHQLVVVDKEDSKKVRGLLPRSDILWAYNEFVDEQKELMQRECVEMPGGFEDYVQVEKEVAREDDNLAFQKIKDLALPRHCIIALIQRGEGILIPHGESVIEPGDVLVFLTTRSQQRKLNECIATLGAKE